MSDMMICCPRIVQSDMKLAGYDAHFGSISDLFRAFGQVVETMRLYLGVFDAQWRLPPNVKTPPKTCVVTGQFSFQLQKSPCRHINSSVIKIALGHKRNCRSEILARKKSHYAMKTFVVVRFAFGQIAPYLFSLWNFGSMFRVLDDDTRNENSKGMNKHAEPQPNASIL